MVGEIVVIITFEEVAVSAAGVDEALVVCFWVRGFGILSPLIYKLACLRGARADTGSDLFWKLGFYIDFVRPDSRLFQAG